MTNLMGYVTVRHVLKVARVMELINASMVCQDKKID